MRSRKLKYLGMFAAIIGVFILAGLGAAYAWDSAGDILDMEKGMMAPYAVLGFVLVVGGILIYAFVEE